MKKSSEKIIKKLYEVPIRKSLRFLFFTIFLIPVLLLSIFSIHFLYRYMMNWEMENVQTNLIQTEQIFNTTLNQIQSLSDRIYVNKQLQNVILTEYNNIQEVYSDYSELKFFENYLHSYGEVASYRIYTENQTLLDNQFIIKTTPKILQEKWYQNAKKARGQSFWSYETDLISQKKYLSLIRSLWSSGTGQFLGVLVININPNLIQTNLSNLMFEAEIFLEDTPIYSSKKELSEESQKLLLEKSKKTEKDKINTITLDGEKIGLVKEEFSPKNTNQLKFSIMYLIPVRQLSKATLQITLITGIVIILLIALTINVITIYSRYIRNRVSKVQKGISNVVENNFEISSSIGGNDEFEQIYHALYEMSENLKDLINKVYTQNLEKEQLAARQSEISFKMLSNQINPHFLFNTLETIRMKAIASGEKEVGTMLKLLASLLRYNLTVKGKPVPLIDEINSIQNYLTIQHMRFGERISYDVVTMCDIQEFTILPLLIQPIVENSFSHGLENRVSGGFIYILVNTEMIGDRKLVTIQVKDNGCGISEDKLEQIREKLNSNKPEDFSSSIGMVNVNSRIKLYYGQECGISIESEIGEGTTVTIKVYA